MYDVKFQGAKYDQLPKRYMSTTEIAALVRADVKAAVKSGFLPGKLSDYRVRKYHNSVRVMAVYKPEYWERGVDGYGNPGIVLSARGLDVQSRIRAMARAYMIDRSEIQVDYFDVNYYGYGEVQDERQAAFEIREKARKAALNRKDP